MFLPYKKVKVLEDRLIEISHPGANAKNGATQYEAIGRKATCRSELLPVMMSQRKK